MNPLSLANRSKARDTMYSDDSSLNLYLFEIGSTPLLTAEQEQALGTRIQAAERDVDGNLIWQEDKDARALLVEANLLLVVSVARNFHCELSYTMLDRIQEGNFGLIKAAEKYDPKRINPKTGQSYRFTTMATWWIRQAIGRAYNERHGLRRMPTHMATAINKLKKETRLLAVSLGRDATIEELAEALHITPDHVRNVQLWDRTLLSLDMPLEGVDDLTLADSLVDTVTVSDYEAIEGSDLREDVARAFATLTLRERGMMRLHYGLDGDRPHNLADVGKAYGVSRERVRQVKEKALKKLRGPLARFAESERAG